MVAKSFILPALALSSISAMAQSTMTDAKLDSIEKAWSRELNTVVVT